MPKHIQTPRTATQLDKESALAEQPANGTPGTPTLMTLAPPLKSVSLMVTQSTCKTLSSSEPYSSELCC